MNGIAGRKKIFTGEALKTIISEHRKIGINCKEIMETMGVSDYYRPNLAILTKLERVTFSFLMFYLNALGCVIDKKINELRHVKRLIASMKNMMWVESPYPVETDTDKGSEQLQKGEMNE